MDVDHGGGGGGHVPPPQNWERGIVPQILSCCKILSTILLALQCRKMCFCLYSRTFIVSPAMHPPRIPVRSTPMGTCGIEPHLVFNEFVLQTHLATDQPFSVC